MMLLAMTLLTQVGWGQQIIGEFPSQDGGFEGQAGPFGTAASSTEWWRSAAGLTATLNSTGGRSGPKNTSLSISSTNHQSLRGPNVCNIAGSTNYTIQFYYKGDKVSINSSYGNIRGAVSGNSYQYGAYQANQNQSNWTKYSITTPSNPGASSAGFAVISIQESNSSNTATFDIDDVVIYAGSADNSVPNSPGAVSTSNATQTSLDVSWSAASGGVDGGGYVVVRYSTNPNADNDPNQNGIYAVDNTTTNGTGSLTGTIRYIGTGTSFTDNSGLSSGTTYYYKVYTVDKAFNYSSESSGSGTTAATTPSAPTITAITAGNQQLSVAFTAGATGGSALTNYKFSTDGGSNWTAVSPASTSSPVVITGLTNGTVYNVQIRAVNAVGDGAATGSTQGTPTAGTLPVSLLSFSGYKDGIRNQLRWVTSSEINNRGFQVERSSDGQSYQSIGFVNSLAIGGNSQTPLKYSFSDAQPAGVKQYYRLKQTDVDGRNTLSNILLVQGEKPTAFEIASVFPNPTRGQITMLLSAPTNETVNIRVMDLAGRILETRQVNVLTGNNSIPFDLSKQAKGQYLIQVGEKTVRVVRE